MVSNSASMLATSPRWQAAIVLCLAASVAAQYGDPYYNSRTPGRVIAGIVIAICIAVLFLCVFSLMFRRRRRGLTVLPRYGAPWPSGNQQQHNQNQGPYAAYPMANQYPQQSWGGYQPPSGPPPQSDPAPPPPYPGKSQGYDGEENSGYGYSNAPQEGSPKPGGFVAPGTPSSPPPAHVNTNSPWFRSG
ncbi:hypothetical protein C8Q76DRAFT_793004 [Earliella scabrosa]|nr:hypothetical protein C8Q76DRAFT_793004 [Earliella scabrosa]